MSLTQDRLKELLSYDAATGQFTWNVSLRGRFAKAGAVAGGPHSEGYIWVGIDGQKHLAHRLAWLYMTGAFPSDDVDHINGCRTDNRFANLRAATRAENLQNSKKKSGTLSQFKGVSKHKDRWHAQIFCKGVRTSLKYHDTEVAAAKAYDQAATIMHGAFARLNFPSGASNV